MNLDEAMQVGQLATPTPAIAHEAMRVMCEEISRLTAGNSVCDDSAPLDATDLFLSDVRAELARARIKFPGNRIVTVALAEEFGELCKAALDEPACNVRNEAVQTAAMAARLALDGDSSLAAWRHEQGLDELGVRA